ncbi:MAG: glycosyltransferase family 39 protein [Candidatus Bathyarchaeia archaeon]
MTLFDFAITSIIFFPGIIFLFALSKKIGITLNSLEKILYGSILWNFLLIAPSIILGVFTNWITAYFNTFTITSIATTIISITYLTKNHKTPPTTTLKMKLEHIPYTLSFLALLTLSSTVIYFHTIYIEWDAIAHYIPTAKAILTTGGLTSQPYRSLNFIEHPPAIPLTYAWLLNFTNLESLYNLALIYFILTITTIFLIVKKFFTQKGALTSSLVFMSLPTVIIVISSRSLYLDLSFILCFLSTLYCTIKITNTQKTTHNSLWFEYVMLAIGFTMMVLTRTEFGIFIAPALFAIFIATLKPKNWEITSTLMLGLAYYLREIRNILLDPSSWLCYIQRLTPVFIISGLILVIIKNVPLTKNQNTKNKELNKKLLTLTLIPLLPLIIYILKNIIISGFVVPGIPISNKEIFKSATFFNEINPHKSISLMEMLQWDYFVSVWWLIPPYLIPASISIASVLLILLKKKNIPYNITPILFFFASVSILWSTLSCDPQPRRLYYFAPFIALIVTHGLFVIKKLFSPFGFALRIPLYITAVTTYTLTKTGAKTINDISLLYSKLYQPATDIEFIAVSALIFSIIFTPYENLINKIKRKIQLSRRAFITTTALTFGLNVILLTSSMSPIITDVVNKGSGSRYEYYGGWLHYPEVVNYYDESIADNFVTMGFYCHELITFANRFTIDLSDPIYGMPIYSIITTANETEILNRMRELNVKYFLEPKKNNPFFLIYERLVNSTVLGNIFVDNPQLRYLATFKYATLYAFHENYTLTQLIPTTIAPWNYNPETNYTLTTEQNTTKFTATTNNGGKISLMYTFNKPLAINEALWLTIKTYNQSKLVAIMFTNLQNRTTDYFSYQCLLTNQTRKPVINLKQGTTEGNFNSNHIEGILIGIETQPNTTQTFEIYQLNIVTYNN